MSLKYTGGIQENVYSADLNNIAYANQNGVLTGCEVTVSTPLAMSVDASSGNVFFGNDEISVIETTGLALSSNTTGFTRLDLIVTNTTGTISVIEGTAAQIPTTPDYDPDDYIVLGRVKIPTGTTSISVNMIKDLRVLNVGGAGGSGSGSFGRHVEEFTSQTSVTVTHNLADDEPIVQVYNGSNIKIEPDSVTIIDVNSLTVTFATATSGKIIIHGGNGVNNGMYETSITAQTTTTITHNLQHMYPNVVCYDSSEVLVEPQSVTAVDEDSLTIVFNSSFTGTVMVSGGIASSNLTTTMGTIVHGSSTTETRPSGYTIVTWIGSVEPTNMETNDLWIDNS